jgi:uncharacterized membrane protein
VRAVHLFLKRTNAPHRLCAVSDGVYAFALTLLVLDLKVPEVAGITNPQLTTDLLTQLPNFFAYAIGFSVVAFFWNVHHRVFQSITSCDTRAVILNFAHLLFISLTPYGASLIGHYEGDRIATIVFSSDLGLASLSMNVLGHYVLAKKEWRTNDTGGTWVKIPLWITYTGPGIAVVSILVSFINIDVALFLWFLLPLRDLAILLRSSPGSSPINNP